MEETASYFVESKNTVEEITTDKHVKTCDETKVSYPPSMRKKIEDLLALYTKKDTAPSADKKFSCNKCEFVSIHRIAFKKHILAKHEGIRYQCEQCEKNYSDSGALWKHKRTVHEGFVHECDICEKQFPEPSAAYRHKKSMHSLNI